MFKPVSVYADTERQLKALLRDEDHQVVLAEFALAALPMLSVADREVRLNAHMESDTADVRFGAAALKIAHMHTKKSEQRRPNTRYVNMASPLIQRLLELPELRQSTVVVLLRAFCDTSVAPDNEHGESRLSESLNAFNDAMLMRLGSDAERGESA